MLFETAPIDPSAESNSITLLQRLPAEIDLNGRITVPLELTYNGLQNDEAVIVFFDGGRSLDNIDACLHLTSDETNDVKLVYVFTYNTETGTMARISNAGTSEVAHFTRANNYTPENDALIFLPVDTNNDVASGTYTGTVYFVIEFTHI